MLCNNLNFVGIGESLVLDFSKKKKKKEYIFFKKNTLWEFSERFKAETRSMLITKIRNLEIERIISFPRILVSQGSNASYIKVKS